ncbi:MAG: hypothetical protein DLM64_02925 [Solirubrobacterales bacterium]|nr:MAG: hypothetical protein DLM64_02925 [Solirubrobacterales bacterium]
MATSTHSTIRLAGMSCRHCMASVTEQVGEVAGVDRVDVDLALGTVTVTGSAIDDCAVCAAIATAGYDVIA